MFHFFFFLRSSFSSSKVKAAKHNAFTLIPQKRFKLRYIYIKALIPFCRIVDDPFLTHPTVRSQKVHYLRFSFPFKYLTPPPNHFISISFILQITQHQDQLLNPLKMNMNRVEQQVIRFPVGKTTPVGYLPDTASINKFRVSASSKKSEQC